MKSIIPAALAVTFVVPAVPKEVRAVITAASVTFRYANSSWRVIASKNPGSERSSNSTLSVCIPLYLETVADRYSETASVLATAPPSASTVAVG